MRESILSCRFLRAPSLDILRPIVSSSGKAKTKTKRNKRRRRKKERNDSTFLQTEKKKDEKRKRLPETERKKQRKKQRTDIKTPHPPFPCAMCYVSLYYRTCPRCNGKLELHVSDQPECALMKVAGQMCPGGYRIWRNTNLDFSSLCAECWEAERLRQCSKPTTNGV